MAACGTRAAAGGGDRDGGTQVLTVLVSTSAATFLLKQLWPEVSSQPWNRGVKGLDWSLQTAISLCVLIRPFLCERTLLASLPLLVRTRVHWIRTDTYDLYRVVHKDVRPSSTVGGSAGLDSYRQSLRGARGPIF